VSLNIHFYSDLSCPWCLIGEARLERVIARHFADLDLRIEHFPVLLMPDLPPAGVLMDDYIRKRFGLADPSAAWSSAEAEARASGITFDHRRVRTAYPTDRAHTIIRLSRGTDFQHRLAAKLARAYLMEGLNIADPALLATVAGEFGMNREEMATRCQDRGELEATRELVRAGKERGVRAVPHYVFAGGRILTGNQTETALENEIRHALEADVSGNPSGRWPRIG
jgi:predicted DsbA family dithiol-disulfide isomerase